MANIQHKIRTLQKRIKIVHAFDVNNQSKIAIDPHLNKREHYIED